MILCPLRMRNTTKNSPWKHCTKEWKNSNIGRRNKKKPRILHQIAFIIDKLLRWFGCLVALDYRNYNIARKLLMSFIHQYGSIGPICELRIYTMLIKRRIEEMKMNKKKKKPNQIMMIRRQSDCVFKVISVGGFSFFNSFWRGIQTISLKYNNNNALNEKIQHH